jgi:hypothetical protein
MTNGLAKIIKKVEDINCPLGYYTQGEVDSWLIR